MRGARRKDRQFAESGPRHRRKRDSKRRKNECQQNGGGEHVYSRTVWSAIDRVYGSALVCDHCGRIRWSTYLGRRAA